MAASPSNQLQILNRLKTAELELEVCLAKKEFSIADLLRLSPGSVLKFPTSAEEPISLIVNNKELATGFAVESGEHYCLELSEIISENVAD